MSNIKSPPENLETLAQGGQAKASQSPLKSLSLAFLAGAYIGLGALFALKVSGNLPPEWGNISKLLMGAVFPVGLLKSWVTSWCGNFVGGLFVAFFIGYSTGAMLDPGPNGSLPVAATAVKLANAKCALAFDAAFWRGVGCNWLVCLGVFLAATAPDGVSKVLLFWPPITCFVALGFEHSVANMCFVPLGIFLGQSQVYLEAAAANPLMPALTANWSTFLINNLIPMTLGNIVGGLLLISVPYQAAFQSVEP